MRKQQQRKRKAGWVTRQKISISLKTETRDAAKAAAKAEGRTLSNYIEWVLGLYHAAHAKPSPPNPTESPE